MTRRQLLPHVSEEAQHEARLLLPVLRAEQAQRSSHSLLHGAESGLNRHVEMALQLQSISYVHVCGAVAG